MPKNRQYSIQLTHQIRQHIIINIPIPGECTAAFLVPGQLTDYVRVRSFLVEVADEGATGEVAACLGIDDSNNAVKSCLFEHCLDVAIVLLQCGNGELRFDTDVDVIKNPESIIDITDMAIYTMATKLWGGNEHSVVAMIRALFMADMALSPDRDVISKGLTRESKVMYEIFQKSISQCGKVHTFLPGSPQT